MSEHKVALITGVTGQVTWYNLLLVSGIFHLLVHAYVSSFLLAWDIFYVVLCCYLLLVWDISMLFYVVTGCLYGIFLCCFILLPVACMGYFYVV